MVKTVSQKEALEIAIKVTGELLESTKNKEAQAPLESALMYLGSVRSFIKNNGIPEKDMVLLMENTNKTVKVEV